MAFPNNMFVFRKRAGLTQAALARKVDVSQPRISAIESEVEDMPPMNLMEKIAEAIGFKGEASQLQERFDDENPGI